MNTNEDSGIFPSSKRLTPSGIDIAEETPQTISTGVGATNATNQMIISPNPETGSKHDDSKLLKLA